MAEELLGVELDIHGGGVDLVFPHHENEAAQTLGARGKPLARLWMHNGMLQLAAEKMSKSVGQHPRARRRARRSAGATRCVMYFCAGHYRQPIAFSRERLDDAARERRADPRGGAAAGRRRLAGGAGAAARRVLRRPRRRLQHAARAGARCSTGSARPTGARAPVGGAHLREMLERAGAREPARGVARGAPAGGRRAGRSRARATRARRATSPRRTACATRLRAPAGRSATARTGRSWSPRHDPSGRARPPPAPPMIIYGRNAVREALRGRAPRRAGSGRPRARRRTRRAGHAGLARTRSRARCGSDAHQGVCAEVDDYRYADAAELLARARAVARRARRGHRPAEPRRRLPHGRVRRRDRVVIPERRSAEVTAGGLQGVARARSSTCAIARVRNLADFLGDAKDGRLLGLRRGRRRAHAATDAPDYRGGVVAGARRGGQRAAPAGRGDRATSWSRCPLRGRIDSLNVSATAAVLLYEILQQRLDAST